MSRTLAAILLLSGTFAFAQSDSVFLFSECSQSSEIRRVVQSSDVVVVRHSFAGYAETCYAVTVSGQNGKKVDGFLIGVDHPAIARFESQEQDYIAQSLPAPAQAKPSQPKTVAARRKPPAHRFWNPFSSRAGTK